MAPFLLRQFLFIKPVDLRELKLSQVGHEFRGLQHR